MADPRDYYEVLGVPRDADEKTIKDAFRQLALKYHPDRNKEPGATDRFKEIAEAYAVLSDPKKRTEYDARGYAGVADFSAEDLFGGVNFEDIFGGLGFDFGGMGPFDRFFRRRATPRRGENIEIAVAVPLERVLNGGEETVHVGRTVPCQACQGSGAKAGTKPRACPKCGGSGRLVRGHSKGGVRVQQITTCPDCEGRGALIDTPCPECGGKGQILRDEVLTVRIPVGVEEGMALRVPGRGLPAEEPGLPAGDLFVVVHTADDPRFERHGPDLYRIETIDVVDAALGASIDVPTVDGQIALKVPAGAQPDSVLRVRSKGLPRFGGEGRGDLYVRLQVHVPERLSPRQRSLFEQLRETGIPRTPAKS
ncbi:MAG TPA: molecular chaperone DnaJ [Roseiarcus sp.]|nr:molecular chaperone DnaJ [Roseiarcus sp.]